VSADTCISSVFRQNRQWESIQVLSIAIARPKDTKTIDTWVRGPSISAIKHDRNIILVSTHMFSEVGFSTVPSPTRYTVPFCQKSRWQTWNQKITI